MSVDSQALARRPRLVRKAAGHYELVIDGLVEGEVYRERRVHATVRTRRNNGGRAAWRWVNSRCADEEFKTMAAAVADLVRRCQ